MTVDGRRVPPDQRVRRRRRSAAALRRARCGARAPTSRSRAASRVAPVFGSRATHLSQPDGRPRRPGAAAPATGCRCGETRSTACPTAARRVAGRRCRRGCPMATPRSACCRVRRTTTSPHDALDVLQSAPYTIGQSSDRMGFRLEGTASHARARRRHHLGRDAAGRGAGAGVGPADPADGRPADHRRLSEARDGDHGRHRPGRPARPRRHDLVRRLLAGRGAGGADRPGTRADGDRASGGRRERLRRGAARRRSAPSACATACRSRRSRPSGSAGRPTGWSRRAAATRSSRR